MNQQHWITVLGIFGLCLFGLVRILEFYGVNIGTYGPYLAFYVFLLVSVLALCKPKSKLK